MVVDIVVEYDITSHIIEGDRTLLSSDMSNVLA